MVLGGFIEGGLGAPTVDMSIVVGVLEPSPSWSRPAVVEDDAEALDSFAGGAAAASGEGAEPLVEGKPEEGNWGGDWAGERAPFRT